MEEILGREGLIAHAHPEYEYRPGQIVMAEAVARDLDVRLRSPSNGILSRYD